MHTVRETLHAGPANVAERTRAVAEWWRRTVEELRELVARYDRAQGSGELGRLVHECHRNTSQIMSAPEASAEPEDPDHGEAWWRQHELP